MKKKEWQGFTLGKWESEICVQDFIQKNYVPYVGDSSFLCSSSPKTKALFEKCSKLLEAEMNKGGVLSVDTEKVSGINAYEPSYIDKDLELIYGLQTEKPLERSVNPYGGIRMAKQALEAYGYEINKGILNTFTNYRKTHNEAVFDAYTKDIRKARKHALITGLPDAYGRGRIIGDYRRPVLYGLDLLIEEKRKDLELNFQVINEENIKLREEISEQIKALEELKLMAASYEIDMKNPAKNAREAFQFLYFSYLAAIKEQNGAAMSLGRTSTFLDIYIERDLKNNLITEEEAQELVDQFIIKLRLARQLRTPEYNELFAGDPMWITESIGGMGMDGRTLVTKNSFRYLQTLNNLGPAPEPNLTILWAQKLPLNFKKFCAKMSIKTNSIQYENDDLMREMRGDDYSIACCVSAMETGHEMQFFGARCNIAKTLLLAINEGFDEKSFVKIVHGIDKLNDEYLDYNKVMTNYKKALKWVVKTYVDALNTIHFMHDKYAYEKIMMALHDSKVERLMAFGIAGFSVAADSLSAIKYAKVKPIRNKEGIAIDFEIEGTYPSYGNDDDRADNIAKELAVIFLEELKLHKLYRNARHTLSILTITSNVMYGKKTGATPDGRKSGVPFAPGANPMAGRDKKGTLAFLNSVSKIPYSVCEDGISCTMNVIPSALGKEDSVRVNNLYSLLDGYFNNKAHHLNVNVISKEVLIDAMNNPSKYPQLTIRVSGYAVHFVKLTKEQQKEVISRTFHEKM